MNLPSSDFVKDKKPFIVGISLFLFIVVFAIIYLLVTRFNVEIPVVTGIVNSVNNIVGIKNNNRISSSDKNKTVEIVPLYDKKTKKPNAEFFELAMEKDFKEVQKQTGGQVTSPNLYQQDLREEFDKQIDRQIQNFIVIYTDNGFGPGTITITQGDLVTFENASSTKLKIVGESWGSGLELDNKEVNRFSQQFDLLGTYKYSASTNPDHKGTVIVIKVE